MRQHGQESTCGVVESKSNLINSILIGSDCDHTIQRSHGSGEIRMSSAFNVKGGVMALSIYSEWVTSKVDLQSVQPHIHPHQHRGDQFGISGFAHAGVPAATSPTSLSPPACGLTKRVSSTVITSLTSPVRGRNPTLPINPPSDHTLTHLKPCMAVSTSATVEPRTLSSVAPVSKETTVKFISSHDKVQHAATLPSSMVGARASPVTPFMYPPMPSLEVERDTSILLPELQHAVVAMNNSMETCIVAPLVDRRRSATTTTTGSATSHSPAVKKPLVKAITRSAVISRSTDTRLANKCHSNDDTPAVCSARDMVQLTMDIDCSTSVDDDVDHCASNSVMNMPNENEMSPHYKSTGGHYVVKSQRHQDTTDYHTILETRESTFVTHEVQGDSIDANTDSTRFASNVSNTRHATALAQ